MLLHTNFKWKYNVNSHEFQTEIKYYFTQISNEIKMLFYKNFRQKQYVISHGFQTKSVSFSHKFNVRLLLILDEFPTEIECYYTRFLHKNKMVFYMIFKQNWNIISHEV